MESLRKELISFWRKFERLLSSGIPLAQSLEVIGKESSDKGLSEIIRNITIDIESGESLSVSLAKHPSLFPPSIQAIVKSGEVQGNLDEVSSEIAAGLEDGTFAPADDALHQDESDLAKGPAVSGEEDKLLLNKHINSILREAVRRGASDIHLEWVKGNLRVRYRIDGVLEEIAHDIPEEVQNAAISRIKYMAGLDTAEKRIPQQGRIMLGVEGKEVDARVSVVPCVTGESAVIRLLQRGVTLPPLDQQCGREELEKMRKWIRNPNGLIMVTGPAGSGKTTTLLSLVEELNSPKIKIVTVEDPVEYLIDGINQQQIDPRIGLTYARGIRAALRQDPDVIMVGELMDLETGQWMINAALTGHLVLTQLHTNSPPETVRRLLDMGIEPFLLNSVPVCIVSQRLIRKICEKCREEYKPEAWLLDSLKDHKDMRFFRGKGCDNCRDTGYRGRIAVREMLEVDDKLRRLIARDAGLDELREEAVQSGMVPMFEDGIAKVEQGITTIEEVFRVCAFGS